LEIACPGWAVMARRAMASEVASEMGMRLVIVRR
jgi:hypothetical protein